MRDQLRAVYTRALQAIADAGGIEGDTLKPIACPFDPAVPADRLGLAMIAAALHERQRRGYAAAWESAKRDALSAIGFPDGSAAVGARGVHQALPILILERASQERTDALHAYAERVIGTMQDRRALQPIEYILTELTANIWDHAETERGFIAAGVDQNALIIVVVDAGLSIPFSYARRGIEFPRGLSYDIASLEAALEGKSARPQGGRGYGLRTSAALVVEGWGGSFLLASQRALRYHAFGTSPQREIELPLWNGTVVAVSLPLPLRSVDLYAYVER